MHGLVEVWTLSRAARGSMAASLTGFSSWVYVVTIRAVTRIRGRRLNFKSDMKKFLLMLALVFAVALLGQPKAQAGGFFFGFPIPIPVPAPAYYPPPSYYYGPGYGYGPGYYGPGYYASGYYWGPSGYVYYRHPYWHNRYWYHRHWYYR
jgi:hypothetical protein